MSEKKKQFKKRLTLFVHKTVGEEFSPDDKGSKAALKNILRILFGSITKFLGDEGLLRAASISYSLVISFVPMMIVGLLVTARIIDKEKYFLFAREFIKKNGIPVDPEPYFNIINELLNNANAITGAGFVILLFSATSVLRNLEAAVNRIWKIRKNRPLMQKISGFILVLIFGPALITIGLSMGKKVVRIAAAPAITNFEQTAIGINAVGEKSLYLRRDNGKWKTEDILSRVDFDTTEETALISRTTNQIVKGEEKRSLLAKIYQPSKNDLKLVTFTSYYARGDNSWIVTDNGCILNSQNNEKSWKIQCFQIENSNLLFKLEFNKIEMINSNEGYIIGNKGLILKTNNGGITWTPSFVHNVSVNLSGFLNVNNKEYLVVGDKLTILKTIDGGKNWRQLTTINNSGGKEKVNLTSIQHFQNKIWITGDYGTLYHSNDKGETWQNQNPGITAFAYRDIIFTNSNRGLLIGENGLMRITDDGGKIWNQLKPVTEEDLNKIVLDKKSGKIYVAGDEYVILEGSIDDLSNFHVVQDSPIARTVLYAVGSFFLPFIFIAVIFFLVFKILPFTDVQNKAAFYGAAVTSLLWVIFLLGFKLYISSFSKGTFIIYGTLAAIPLLLLMVYISVSIILYGAEISFFIQNPGLLRVRKDILKIDDDKRQIWHGLKILHVLFSNFDKGKGPTDESSLVKVCRNDYLEFNYIIEKFTDHGIVEMTEKKKYTPVVSPSTILMKDLIADLDPVDYSVPDSDFDPEFKEKVEKFFNLIKKSKADLLGSTTFAEFYQSEQPIK